MVHLVISVGNSMGISWTFIFLSFSLSGFFTLQSQQA